MKEILTDPEKQRIYDKHGFEGIKSGITNQNSPFSAFPGQSSLFLNKKKILKNEIFVVFSI